MLPWQRRPSTAVSPSAPAALPGRPGRVIAAVGFLTGLVMVAFGIAAWEGVSDDFATRGATITSLAARSVRLFYRQFEDTLDSLATEILDEQLLDDPRGAPSGGPPPYRGSMRCASSTPADGSSPTSSNPVSRSLSDSG